MRCDIARGGGRELYTQQINKVARCTLISMQTSGLQDEDAVCRNRQFGAGGWLQTANYEGKNEYKY